MSNETTTAHDEPTTEAPAYDGPARLLVQGDDGRRELEVQVALRGVFQPIDGRYHWYGRVRADEELSGEELAEAVRPGTTVLLRTPHGEAEARLSDLDPWGRYRVSGTGRPPFAGAR